MAETLESGVREVLRNYVREVKSLPNESAKRSRFASLIAELFPGSTAINEYARGVEKLIRVVRPSGVKKGRERGSTVLTIQDIERIGIDKTIEIALESRMVFTDQPPRAGRRIVCSHFRLAAAARS